LKKDQRLKTGDNQMFENIKTLLLLGALTGLLIGIGYLQ
jgi:hypothetical protein